MPDKMEKLKETLRDKSPLLLLGAGFSLDAVDGKGRPMPSGKKLANELFDTVLAKALNAPELEELKEYRDELKKVCDCIRDENLVEERNTEANNAFREAAGIRGHRSYQVEHAEAKNYMEWGIWELSHNQSHASFYFEQGKIQMANLIQFAPHKYFAYSVHTYVDMVLRYYTNLNESLDPTEANYIANQILILLSNNKDGYSIPISKRFVKVCERDCPEIDLAPIQIFLGRSHNISNVIFDADLLSDDSDIQVTL